VRLDGKISDFREPGKGTAVERCVGVNAPSTTFDCRSESMIVHRGAPEHVRHARSGAHEKRQRADILA